MKTRTFFLLLIMLTIIGLVVLSDHKKTKQINKGASLTISYTDTAECSDTLVHYDTIKVPICEKIHGHVYDSLMESIEAKDRIIMQLIQGRAVHFINDSTIELIELDEVKAGMDIRKFYK